MRWDNMHPDSDLLDELLKLRELKIRARQYIEALQFETNDGRDAADAYKAFVTALKAAT